MKKLVVLFAAILVLVIGSAVWMYVANPYGTATWDPRGRIIGVLPYRMPSDSMAPTLKRNQVVVVSTRVYRNSLPDYNDIIVFLYPRNPQVVYIKRVVGRPGDRVRISAGQVYVNDAPLDQPYVAAANNRDTAARDFAPVAVPEGMLFVLGDNRDHSNDSRYWGFVPVSSVVGKVVLDF